MATVDVSETKRCTVCRKVKPIDEFRWHNYRKRYRVARCKACLKVNARKYYHNSNSRGTGSKLGITSERNPDTPPESTLPRTRMRQTPYSAGSVYGALSALEARSTAEGAYWGVEGLGSIDVRCRWV